MKVISKFASFCLLALIVSLSACRKDEDLLPRGEGFILAGETGPGIFSTTFNPAISVSPGGSTTVRDVPIFPDLDVVIRLGANYSSQAGTSTYTSASIGTGGIALEFAWFNSVDSIFVCDQWASDSSTLDRTIYSLGSGFQCDGGARSFSYLHDRKVPKPRDAGFRFDSQSEWTTDANMLYLSNYLYNYVEWGSTQVHEVERYTYAPWQGQSEKYLGFRFLTNGTYRYGYLQLTVNGNSISILGYGVEDPAQE